EIGIRADVRLPERRISATITLRRNTDRSLPATHTMDINFTVPDSVGGGIGEVAGVLMKPGEQALGAPLSTKIVKVTRNVFLVGLSAIEADAQRNLELLKERAWFDIPIVYANGRRAILALAKGDTGLASFKSAFAAWHQ